MKTKLKELRLQHQMTQEQLAKRINVSSRTIISLETGKYNPSIYKQISILHLRWQTKNTDILYL